MLCYFRLCKGEKHILEKFPRLKDFLQEKVSTSRRCYCSYQFPAGNKYGNVQKCDKRTHTSHLNRFYPFHHQLWLYKTRLILPLTPCRARAYMPRKDRKFAFPFCSCDWMAPKGRRRDCLHGTERLPTKLSALHPLRLCHCSKSTWFCVLCPLPSTNIL